MTETTPLSTPPVTAPSPTSSSRLQSPVTSDPNDGSHPTSQPQGPAVLPGPFHPRPIERRGLPWTEQEKRDTLYDGYSPSHGDGIIDFCVWPEQMPPDIQAYCALVHRVSLASPFTSRTELFKVPVELEEVASGARYLEGHMAINTGLEGQMAINTSVFVARNDWIAKTPVDPSRVALWAETLSHVRRLDDEAVSRGEKRLFVKDVHVGPICYTMMVRTNIRAMYPSYILPVDWSALLPVTYQLYSLEFHPITQWACQRYARQVVVESYVYTALCWAGGRVIDEQLIPEDLREELEGGDSVSSGSSDGSRSHQGFDDVTALSPKLSAPSSPPQEPATVHPEDDSNPADHTQAPTLSPGHFYPRPMERRGHPWSEEEKQSTLFDGYSPSHGDGIIDFGVSPEVMPPDVQAYCALVHRIRLASMSVTQAEMFKVPVEVEEIASGAAYLEEQMAINEGVFVDRNDWIEKTPADPCRTPLWTHTLSHVRQCDDDASSRGEQPIYLKEIAVGPICGTALYKTNIRAMFPSYMVPVDWKALLQATYQLYHTSYHPFSPWILDRVTRPLNVESYVYDAISWVGNLINEELVPEEVRQEVLWSDDEDASGSDRSWYRRGSVGATAPSPERSAPSPPPQASHSDDDSHPPGQPQAPALLPGPFHPRPVERRGQPWNEEEKQSTLYDGYSPSHGDGIIDFGVSPELMPPDIQAYCALMHRVSLASPLTSKAELFEAPIQLGEVASGAKYLEGKMAMNKGIFVARNDWIDKAPVDPSRTALWAETLSHVRKTYDVSFPPDGRRTYLEGIIVGPACYTSLYSVGQGLKGYYVTNIRAMYPPYMVPVDWSALLAVTYQLYCPDYHPITHWINDRCSRQFHVESYVCTAVAWTRRDLIDWELVPEDLREEMEGSIDESLTGSIHLSCSSRQDFEGVTDLSPEPSVSSSPPQAPATVHPTDGTDLAVHTPPSTPAPPAPTFLPGPFQPRPIERRGQPWSEEEKRSTLFDGYSPSHGDGIIDFGVSPELMPPDIQAYCALVHRIRLASVSTSEAELFKVPVQLEEVASGATYLEGQMAMDKGVFVVRDDWIAKTPVDPTRVALWVHTLSHVRKLDDESFSRGERHIYLKDIHIGPISCTLLYKTNIRAMYPLYIVPVNWSALLAVTYQLYCPSFHPITPWILDRRTQQFDVESYVYDAVTWARRHLIDRDLLPQDVLEEAEGGDDESSTGSDGSWSLVGSIESSWKVGG